nr:hypothetical protein [Tanacetum cinerariifolium]
MMKHPILRKLITMMNKKSVKSLELKQTYSIMKHRCAKNFKEFNYLIKIDPDLLTKDIEGFKTYKEFKDDWIYEWNNDVPWVHEKPWINYGAWNEPTPVTHCCKPFNYKTGCSEWPTCGWREDGYCNRRNLHGAYIIGNLLHYQDYEWYKALEDEELKEEALRNKAIMEGTTDDDDEQEICNHEIHELPVCNIRRFEMIKYSFGDDEEYIAVKEDENDDLTSTRKDACRAYQEIFRMMDEGCMDLAAKKSTKLVKYQSSRILLIMEHLAKDGEKDVFCSINEEFENVVDSDSKYAVLF